MNIKKIICCAVAASVLGMSTVGCYGSFAITNKLSQWNSQATGNKMINGILALLLTVTGIYPAIMVVGDLVLLNTIEFWFGSNPLAMNDTFEQFDETTGATVLATKNADGSLTLTATSIDGEVNVVTLEREANVVRVLDENGAFLAMQTIAE